jgi:2-polyprenyl-6-methoxyphenol 4-hydroxylase
MTIEVCIVGGGLVGLTAALAFSAQGRTVTLIESMDLHMGEPDQLDARSIALSHSSVQILRALNVWPGLQHESAAIRHIHVSSAGHFGVTRLAAKALDLDAMGYVVEYHRLMQVLLEHVKADSGIQLVSPASFKTLSDDAEGMMLEYRQGDDEFSVQADLLVVADGANSSARDLLDIQASVEDFNQNAIVANVEIENTVTEVAYERFTANGPMAMLPLPHRRYALVWANSPQRTQQLMEMADSDFLNELYAHFGYRVGVFKRMGARNQFPLRLTRAKQLVSGRCVLIGNAANSLHPVAGQGLNLALRDIAVLYDQLSGIDMGSDRINTCLERYQQARKNDQDQTVRLGNSLVKLFSNDLPLINHARSAALMALDACPLLKQEFSWLGMGYGSGVASLMRGAA